MTTVTPEGHEGADLVTYDGGEDMVYVETEVFTFCQSFPIAVVDSGVDNTSTVVVADSFGYTIIEEEVLPAFLGGPY